MAARDESARHLIDRLGVVGQVIVPTALQAAVRADRDLDLSLPQLATLFLVRREGSLTVNEVADLAGGSLSSASRLVNHLVSRDLVDRAEDPADRRVKRVTITRQGQHLLTTFERGVTESHVAIFEHLTAEERKAVVHALAGVAAAAERHAASARPARGTPEPTNGDRQ